MIRIEHTQDVTQVGTLAKRWLEECRATDYGLHTEFETVEADLQTWLENSIGSLIVAYDGIESVGVMAIFRVRSTIGHDSIALVKYWYVPGHNKAATLALYREGQSWAQRNGCSHMILSASWLGSEAHDRICEFCEGQQMAKIETSYLLRL